MAPRHRGGPRSHGSAAPSDDDGGWDDGGNKRRRGHGRTLVSPRRRRQVAAKATHNGFPQALKVILGALRPSCLESAELWKCADAVLKKFRLREHGNEAAVVVGVGAHVSEAELHALV